MYFPWYRAWREGGREGGREGKSHRVWQQLQHANTSLNFTQLSTITTNSEGDGKQSNVHTTQYISEIKTCSGHYYAQYNNADLVITLNCLAATFVHFCNFLIDCCSVQLTVLGIETNVIVVCTN